MRRFRALVLSIFSLSLAGSALADPVTEVPDYNLHYRIYQDPSNPESPVVFTVSFYLTPRDKVADAVGWHIDAVRVKEYAPDGALLGVWTIEDPALTTADGLWWISHENPETPDLAEYAVPPLINQTARAESVEPADLHVYFAGIPNTGNFKYTFAMVGDSTPVAEGDDEPGEIENDGDNQGDSCIESGE